MNQNSISKNKFVPHQNSQSRGTEDYLRQASFVPGFSYAATLPPVGGSYTHDMNKQVQAAPGGLYSSSPSGPMTGAGPQHHQPGLGGPVPTPPSTSMVPTQGQQLNARSHMASMSNYSRQNTSRQVPNMSRSSIATVVSQSTPPTMQQYGTVPMYSQQATYTTMPPQATMLMQPHVINYQRSNFAAAAPHQFSMPSSQAVYIHGGNNWNSYNHQPAVFFSQMSHMTSTCPPQLPTQMQTQPGPKKTNYKGLAIIDPATGRDVREDIANEPPSHGSKDASATDIEDNNMAMIFAAKVSQAIAQDSQNKLATAPDAPPEALEDNSCDLPTPEDDTEIQEFPEQYSEPEAVICTENPTVVPYYNRDSVEINSISEAVSIEKVNSIASSEPMNAEIPKETEYCKLNDDTPGKNEDFPLPPITTTDTPIRLEPSEITDDIEKDSDVVIVSDESVDSDSRKVSEETEVLPRPSQVDVENVLNSKNDDSGFKNQSRQPFQKVENQQNGDIHKSNSVMVTTIPKEEKSLAEVGKKKKNKKKDLNKKGESKEGGDMDAFLDKPEEVIPAVTKSQVQQIQQPIVPSSTTVITRPDSPVTDSVQDSELLDGESEKIQQNDTAAVTSDQLQESPTLSSEETDAKDIKESPVEEASKTQITLKYNYKEDQWSPLNPEGKKQYDREFLLNMQSQPMSMKKPSNLPNLDVIKDKATLHKLNEVNNRIASTAQYAQRAGYTDPFEPAFARTSAPGRPMHPGIKGRGSQQGRENKAPRKITLGNTINQQVKLHTAEKAWMPTRNKGDTEDNDARTQLLYKRVRGILNKLTPQKFGTLVSQVRQLDITTEESLNGVIDLVFEKAIDEPNFSVPYANMCKHLALLKVNSDVEGQSINFRKLLLTKCQKEFEKDRTDEQNRAERIRLIEECETEEKRKQLQEEFEEEERKNRRRQLGNIRFIGELFKLGMLTEPIMHQCIKKLLLQGDEDSLECLCRLLTTIGKELESEKKVNAAYMDSYFNDMKKVVDKRKTSSRVRFMLQDVIDLRMNNWVPRRDENNPKTIDQIHKEAEKEAHEQQQMLQQMTFPKRLPDDRDRRKSRPPMTEDGWNITSKSGKGNYNSVDPMKLKLTKPAEAESMQLGPGTKFSTWGKGSSGGTKSSVDQDSRPAVSQNRYSILADQGPALYEARRSSQRSAASSRESSRGRNNQLPPSAVRKTPSVSRERDNAIEAVKSFTRAGVPEQRTSETKRPLEAQNINGKDVAATVLKGAELSVEDIEKKTKPLIDEYLHNCDLEEAVRCVVELASQTTVCTFITSAVNQVLERSSQSRHVLGKLLHTLLKRKIITMEQYNKGLKEVLEFVDDYALDIPLIWDYLGEIIEPILDDDDIGLGFLKETLQPCIPSQTAGKLVSAVLLCASKKRGTLRVGEMWKESKLSWTDFLGAGAAVEDFVKSHKLEFTTKQAAEPKPKVRKQITPEEMTQSLQRLLHDHESNEEIFNWLERHVEGEMSPAMYRALVTVIYESVITGSGAQCELNIAKLKERMCILARYMDVNRNLELHAIFALQHLMIKLDHPKGILLQIFDLAYNEDFLSDDAFKQWEINSDPAEQEGKGVAVHSVSSFFTWLKEGDDDESADGD